MYNQKKELQDALKDALLEMSHATDDRRYARNRVEDIREELKEIEQGIVDVEKEFERIEKRTYTPDMRRLATSGLPERIGVPTGAAALGGVLGYGLSQDSKEHERFRKSTAK